MMKGVDLQDQKKWICLAKKGVKMFLKKRCEKIFRVKKKRQTIKIPIKSKSNSSKCGRSTVKYGWTTIKLKKITINAIGLR